MTLNNPSTIALLQCNDRPTIAKQEQRSLIKCTQQYYAANISKLFISPPTTPQKIRSHYPRPSAVSLRRDL